ncbi:hypothetical protein PAHAL_5G033200 [Panicum hallii]|uniref:Uncharacterized protein n=1 Tax=Panicum hallii TaxID=206008 RepID=A0A2T8IIS2_9POAL|nr:hypothetical protein PAHAL_5G033200 [Panicum hallii]
MLEPGRGNYTRARTLRSTFPFPAACVRASFRLPRRDPDMWGPSAPRHPRARKQIQSPPGNARGWKEFTTDKI